MCKPLRLGFRSDDSKNSGVLIEWISASWRPLPAGIVTAHGFVVCLLPSTMVVLSQNVESFQVLPCLVQWIGVTRDGRRHDCRSPFGQQYVGGVFGGGGDGGQRMDRF